MTSSWTTHIFTDHASLTFIFDPYGHNPGISRQVTNKLMHWALKLSSYRYIIRFLPGDRNVWADLLTRWGSPSRISKAKIAVLYAPVYTQSSEEYDWPSCQETTESQRKSKSKQPAAFKEKDGMIIDEKRRIWIPEDDEKIKLRLLIASHHGVSGHRYKTTTMENIEKDIFWKTMKDDVASFCEICIHCLATDSREPVPRPLGHTMHAEKVNEVLHFDFCYIGKSSNGLV